MMKHARNWLREVELSGRLPHRWPHSGKFIADGVRQAVVERGWATSSWRIDGHEITDAGRAALGSI